MTNRHWPILLAAVCLAGEIVAVPAVEPVSIESLLREMVDRDSVARFPAPEFRLKQESSYNRASTTPDDVAGWFTNHDYTSKPGDKNFIRTEENGGETEWVMPYRDSGTVTLVNLSDQPVDAALKVQTGEWSWDSRSMYFHAAWRGQYPVPTRPFSDWNYGTFTGRGVYVGDTLTVMNPVERWWGEGDEKIWVDGEDFPSIFGTGTEDYYGYSWGGRSTDFYEHPFHAQPRCHVYNKLNRKTHAAERNTQGYSTETRTRSLDTMPFGNSLQLDMEVWSWSECDMGYGVGLYWYGDAATTCNRTPDPEGALRVPPLPNTDKE